MLSNLVPRTPKIALLGLWNLKIFWSRTRPDLSPAFSPPPLPLEKGDQRPLVDTVGYSIQTAGYFNYYCKPCKLRRRKQRFRKIATLVVLKMKICYDQGYNDKGVFIATKWRLYLFYLQQYFLALGTVLSKSFTGRFTSIRHFYVHNVNSEKLMQGARLVKRGEIGKKRNNQTSDQEYEKIA